MPPRVLPPHRVRDPHHRSTHTGAGRIVRLRLRPMSLAERGLVEPTVSLADLLSGADTIGGESPVGLAEYAEEIVTSGFPGLRTLPAPSAQPASTAISTPSSSTTSPTGTRRAPTADAARMVEGLCGCDVDDRVLRHDPRCVDGRARRQPAKTTTIAYRETLDRMWLLDTVPAWTGSRWRVASLGQAPKHHLADPALAARLLGVGTGALLDSPNPDSPPVPRDGTLLGALFESLVTLGVRTYAEAADAQVSHLRTHRGDHEVDLIVAGVADAWSPWK